MEIHRLAERKDVARARDLVYRHDRATLDDLVALTEIAAPPFGEAARGLEVARRFASLGLVDVATDEVGNVLARLPAPASGRPVLVSAHLDTVFPSGTDVRVQRRNGRLYAPGIADNGRGLAGLLAIARVLVEAGVAPSRPIVFVATVGEEGLGDLRGTKHLFREGSPWRDCAGFVSLDGSGRRRIVHRAIGSRRLRIVARGPGGHAWADWGRANPLHALGFVLAELARYAPTRDGLATLNAGRIGGGTAVNAIPTEAWLEVDLRAEDADVLAELEDRVREAVHHGAAEADRLRREGTPGLETSLEVIGDRPSGRIAADAPIVRAAAEATRWIGEDPELAAGSTDANVPIALGIPAITIGAGGLSGGTHTPDEWYENEGGPEGIVRALLTVLAVAEWVGE